ESPRQRALNRAIDPRDERAPVDVLERTGVRTASPPAAELLRELSILFAEPEETDLLPDLRVLRLEIMEHGLGALLGKLLVVHRVAVRARPGDDEKEARAPLLTPGLFDRLERRGIELGLIEIELYDPRPARERLEERVEVRARERGDRLRVRRLAS